MLSQEGKNSDLSSLPTSLLGTFQAFRSWKQLIGLAVFTVACLAIWIFIPNNSDETGDGGVWMPDANDGPANIGLLEQRQLRDKASSAAVAGVAKLLSNYPTSVLNYSAKTPELGENKAVNVDVTIGLDLERNRAMQDQFASLVAGLKIRSGKAILKIDRYRAKVYYGGVKGRGSGSLHESDPKIYRRPNSRRFLDESCI